jgi:hypothetical protein
MTGSLNFKTLVTLRMPEEGKSGFGLIFSKTRMMEPLMMLIQEYDFAPSWLRYNCMDRFRCTQYIVTKGAIRDDMEIFIISHCPCFVIDRYWS